MDLDGKCFYFGIPYIQFSLAAVSHRIVQQTDALIA